MRLCVVELNDSEVRAGSGGNLISRSPGYALVRRDGIQLGERALRQAHLLPRQTYNRFWAHLNQDALQTPTPQFRHNADLAWAHLLHIYEQAGKPETVIFAVPGHYSRQQLALLLGIVQSCPFTAAGLVDSAVAAVAAVAGPGRYEHVEMHLHETVYTRIDVAGQVIRHSVQSLDNAGLTAIEDLVADLIADTFIQQCRFDPRQHAQSEQAVYDQIPGTLATLAESQEALLEIEFQQARHQAKLTRNVLHERLGAIYADIRRRLDEDRTPLLGDRIAALPGFAMDLPGHGLIEPEAVFTACDLHREAIRGKGPDLNFVMRLPAANKPTLMGAEQHAAPPDEGPAAKPSSVTHVLLGHRAFPMKNSALYLSARGNVSTVDGEDVSCSLSSLNSRTVITPLSDLTIYVNGERLSGVRPVGAGDKISFAGAEAVFSLISVVNPDAA